MNNIIKFELKNSYKSLIIWFLGIFLIVVLFASIYPAFAKELDQFISLMNNFPDAVIAALSIEIESWNTFLGFYGYILSYINLLLFSFAASSAIRMFNKEYRTKSIEFLFTKPLKRSKIFISKYSALIILNIIIFTILLLLTLGANYLYGSNSIKEICVVLLGTFLIQILAMNFAIIFAILFTKIKGSGAVGFLIALVFFFVEVIGNILEEVFLQKLSIYGMFNANKIYDFGYEVSSLIIFSVVVIVCFSLGIILYERKDVL